MQNWIWVIQLASVVAVAVAAFFAWRSASAASQSTKATQQSALETQKSNLAQIIIRLRGMYGSPEMFASIKNLYNWKRGHGKEFATVFHNRLEEMGHADAEQLDEDRRRYSHYFHEISALLDCGVVDEKFLKALVTPD